MNKSPQMQNLLNVMAMDLFGRTRTKSIEGNMCVTCGNSVGGFRDELSVKEYTISGMCQKCQDSVFGE